MDGVEVVVGAVEGTIVDDEEDGGGAVEAMVLDGWSTLF